MKQFKRTFVVILLCLLVTLAAWAKFCENCGADMGTNIGEFCERCGTITSKWTPKTTAATVTNDLDEDFKKLNERLTIEAEMRKEICLDSIKPQSDNHSGKTFTAYGQEWRIGQYNIDWNETQSWIGRLGEGWRAPMHSELRGLQKEVNINSEIGNDRVWAEKKSFSTAWLFSFDSGNEYSNTFGYRYYDYRAVAVR